MTSVMTSVMRRVRGAWRRHGVIAFARLAAANVQYYLKKAIFARKRTARENSFDNLNATETGAIREVGSLAISSPNSQFAVRYEPSDEGTAARAIESLAIDCSDFTFVDFGSGKGRVLMIAARHPFKRVMGIEFAPELHIVAQRNLERLPASLTAGGRVFSVCADVMQCELPTDNLVCYFYNPFAAPLMAQVAKRLLVHVARGLTVFVVYVNPKHREVFDTDPNFRELQSSPQSVTFEVFRPQR